jgi:hypothetical protein
MRGFAVCFLGFLPVAIACVADPPETPAGDEGDASFSDAGADSSSSDAAQVQVTTTFGERSGAEHTGVTVDTSISGVPEEQLNNFGSDNRMSAGTQVDGGTISYVGLIRFDVSAIPKTATVVDASLVLWTSAGAGCAVAAGVDINVYQVNQTWVAGNLDNEAGVSNFIYAQADVMWKGPGVTGTSRASTPSGTFSPNDGGVEYEVSIGALAQSWISSPLTNYGLALVGTPSSDNACFISSDEVKLADERPLLKVTYLTTE